MDYLTRTYLDEIDRQITSVNDAGFHTSAITDALDNLSDHLYAQIFEAYEESKWGDLEKMLSIVRIRAEDLRGAEYVVYKARERSLQGDITVNLLAYPKNADPVKPMTPHKFKSRPRPE